MMFPFPSTRFTAKFIQKLQDELYCNIMNEFKLKTNTTTNTILEN